ncbi:hypothetical protein [Nocardia sp. NPDC051833]|uniref:hypothetical protein n=1 Tax=Nocardia sp. NPDC051833 TaxID=3155674 RepID=UPI0034378E07
MRTSIIRVVGVLSTASTIGVGLIVGAGPATAYPWPFKTCNARNYETDDGGVTKFRFDSTDNYGRRHYEVRVRGALPEPTNYYSQANWASCQA